MVFRGGHVSRTLPECDEGELSGQAGMLYKDHIEVSKMSEGQFLQDVNCSNKRLGFYFTRKSLTEAGMFFFPDLRGYCRGCSRSLAGRLVTRPMAV